MGRIWAGVDSVRLRRRPDWLTATFAVLIALGILGIAAPQLFRVVKWQALARNKIPPNILPLIRPELFYSGFMLAALGVLGRSLLQRFGRPHFRPGLLPLATFALLAVTVP